MSLFIKQANRILRPNISLCSRFLIPLTGFLGKRLCRLYKECQDYTGLLRALFVQLFHTKMLLGRNLVLRPLLSHDASRDYTRFSHHHLHTNYLSIFEIPHFLARQIFCTIYVLLHNFLRYLCRIHNILQDDIVLLHRHFLPTCVTMIPSLHNHQRLLSV